MHTVTRSAVAILALSAMVGGWWLGSAEAISPVSVGHGVEVYAERSGQVRLVRWAIGRFEAAELPVPAVEVHFHDDVSGCQGQPGFYAGDRIDLCPGLRLTLIARHDMLHELVHAWSVRGVSEATRERFMAERGLGSWAEGSAGWELRGFEQVAEIVAWGIGDGVIQPRIPDNDPETMTRMFELLTGRAPIS